MRYFVVLAATLAAPAVAQEAPPPRATIPVTETAPVDAARLALARKAVDAAWPLGTYARLMNGQMQDMMDGMMASMMDLKLSDVAKLDAAAGTEENPLGNKSMRQLMAEADPHFEERMRIMNRVVMAEMAPIMDRIEPAFRDGLSHAFARKFNATQLEELNRFFATPTGAAYASESMLMYMEPEAMSAMMQMMPELMAAMPDIMKRVQAATAHLPPPPRPEPEE